MLEVPEKRARKPLCIAVLMTCFNRREQTVRCLEQVFSQVQDGAFTLYVTLVDDASQDGTGDAVESAFPAVNVVRSSGNLYWNQGMRLAFAHANQRECDAYLWLNDDTILYPHAISGLITTMQKLQSLGVTAIVTGSTRDSVNGPEATADFAGAGSCRSV